ncbi:MAG: hypothetical protein AAF195_03025, partial [Pseudomonadota bacterium]
FGWDKDVAAVFFVRAGILWVIFNEPAMLRDNELRQLNSQYLTYINQQNQNNSIIFRFNIRHPIEQISLDKKDNDWKLRFNDVTLNDAELNNAEFKDTKIFTGLTSIDIDDVSDMQNHIVIEHHSSDNKKFIVKGRNNFVPPIIQLTDPFIQDNIHIAMVNKLQLVKNKHAMIDFQLLPSLAGVIVVEKADDITVSVDKNNLNQLIINTPTGHSNDDNKKKTISFEQQSSANYSLLKFEQWQGKEGEFYQNKINLQTSLGFLYGEQKNFYNYELAKLLFANEFYDEAGNILDNIQENSDKFDNVIDFLFLRASIEYLKQDYLTAYKKFSAIINNKSLNHDKFPEINYWFLATKYKLKLLEKSNDEADLLLYQPDKQKFLVNYPKQLQYHFADLAIEQLLKQDRLEQSEVTLDLIDIDAIESQFIQNDFQYSQGLFLKKIGKIDQALINWREIVNYQLDARNRARAEYQIIKTLLESDDISIADAISRYENIKDTWKGDVTEQRILEKLGYLYIDNLQYRKGLRSWRNVLSYFPNDTNSIEIINLMSSTFVSIFLDDKAKKISPVEAISLYYEFKELTPIGERGDQIINKLVEILIEIDLLDRAAGILEHQIKFRLSKEDQIFAGITLAEIYINDRHPQKAIEALDKTAQDNQPIDIEIKRGLLMARALIKDKKFADAEELLKGLPTEEADFLQLDLYWNEQNWQGIIDVLEPLYEIKDTPKPLSKFHSDGLIKLAIAYNFVGSPDKLEYLNDTYQDLIYDNGVNKEKLQFLTYNILEIDPDNFNETVNIEEFREFIRNYSKL